jgi:hypothetical protein
MHSAPETFQLKMHLLDISPMIWRGVLVSSSITLRERSERREHVGHHKAANV